MQFDAFERITQQQHRKLVSDFAWFNKKFAWVEHLNAILAQKVGNMSEPIFQSSNARGVGEWWSLELIYAKVKLLSCTERDSYTNGIFSWLQGEKCQIGQRLREWVCNLPFAVYFFVVWINVSKNELNRRNAHCCLLQIHCLVSSRNVLSLLPLRDESEQKPRGRIR